MSREEQLESEKHEGLKRAKAKKRGQKKESGEKERDDLGVGFLYASSRSLTPVFTPGEQRYQHLAACCNSFFYYRVWISFVMYHVANAYERNMT